MERVVNILMERDGMTREEACELVLECRRALEGGEWAALQEFLGLEDDYIFDVLGY